MLREITGLKLIGMMTISLLFVLNFGTCTGRAAVSTYNRSVLDLPAPGPYMPVNSDDVADIPSFSQKDKILTTFYFYWYDLPSSGTHFFTNYPSSVEGYSWRNVDWHKQEILEMSDVGINLVLPVYWGDTKSTSWSIPGLRKLVEAYESLEAEGVRNLPRIGMFYDTTSLATESKLKNENMRYDLTQEDGKEYFYKLIRDFYSIVPPKYWAQIDGKPIVWLYFGVYASDYDQSTFDYVYRQFAEDFGGKTPYVIKDVTWPKVQTENITVWGGALTPRALGTIVIGPGFDDVRSGRGIRTFRDREDGKFYEDAWIEAIATSNVAGDMNIIAIETWNEWYEATQIAESREYGRQYLDITRQYAEVFFAGEMPPEYPGKEFEGARRVELSFADDEHQHGISYVKVSEGEGTTTNKTIIISNIIRRNIRRTTP